MKNPYKKGTKVDDVGLKCCPSIIIPHVEKCGKIFWNSTEEKNRQNALEVFDFSGEYVASTK